jgi:DNA-binding NtrC family response regulator
MKISQHDQVKSQYFQHKLKTLNQENKGKQGGLMFKELFEKLCLGSEVPQSILVVEDDPSQKPILSRILYALNPSMNLLWASSAEEAKTILSENPIEFLITDILLEGEETGIDLYQLCQKENGDIPVLFISGLSPATLEKRGISFLKAGIETSSNFLAKPISAIKCHDSIHELIKRKEWEKIADSYSNIYP